MTKFSPLAVAAVALLAAENVSAFTAPKTQNSALGALRMVSSSFTCRFSHEEILLNFLRTDLRAFIPTCDENFNFGIFFFSCSAHACNAANDEYLDFNCNCNYKVFHQAYFPLIYYGHPYTYTFPINFCCLVNVPSPIINHREYIPWCMSFISSYAIMLIK